MAEDRAKVTGPEAEEAISPGMSLLVPLLIGCAVIVVAALLSYRYIEERQREAARTQLVAARDALESCLEGLRSGDLERATSAANRAVTLAPELATAHFIRGKVHLARGEYEAAVVDFTNSIRLNNNESDTYQDHLHRGQALVGMKRFEEAEEEFSIALLLQQHSARAFAERARVRERLGNVAGADQDQRQVKHLGGTTP